MSWNPDLLQSMQLPNMQTPGTTIAFAEAIPDIHACQIRGVCSSSQQFLASFRSASFVLYLSLLEPE